MNTTNWVMYNLRLAKMFKSVNCAVLFSFVTTSPNGIWAWDLDVLYDSAGLSEREAIKARDKLIKLGAIKMQAQAGQVVLIANLDETSWEIAR